MIASALAELVLNSHPPHLHSSRPSSPSPNHHYDLEAQARPRTRGCPLCPCTCFLSLGFPRVVLMLPKIRPTKQIRFLSMEVPVVQPQDITMSDTSYSPQNALTTSSNTNSCAWNRHKCYYMRRQQVRSTSFISKFQPVPLSLLRIYRRRNGRRYSNVQS